MIDVSTATARAGVGVGVGASRRSFDAGREAAREALARSGGGRPDLVLVFGTAGHDQAELLRGVVDVTGGAPLSGCSAEGVITQRGSDEGTHAVGVMALASDRMTFKTARALGVSADPRRCAAEIAARAGERDRLLLLFPDGITANCRELVDALEASLRIPVAIAGGASGAFAFDRTYQYHDGAVSSDSVSAVLVGGDVAPEIVVSHGCDLIGTELVITRAERGLVYEIEGRPAWSFFKDYLEEGVEDLDMLNVAHLCVAERLPAGLDSEYGDHVIRMPLTLEKSTGALFFAGGLQAGTRVHMARRNADRITDRAIASARRIATRRPGESPLLVLQFDCAGRGRLLFGESTTRASIAPLLRVFDASVPWLGLHTYGEIAPLGGKTFFHNFTLVLCALYPSGAS